MTCPDETEIARRVEAGLRRGDHALRNLLQVVSTQAEMLRRFGTGSDVEVEATHVLDAAVAVAAGRASSLSDQPRADQASRECRAGSAGGDPPRSNHGPPPALPGGPTP